MIDGKDLCNTNTGTDRKIRHVGKMFTFYWLKKGMNIIRDEMKKIFIYIYKQKLINVKP